MANPRPHISIDNWLEKLDLLIYKAVFENYAGVEDVLWMGERELKDLGIKNGSHRARIGSSLAALKEKYDRANKENQGNLIQTSYSTGFTPPRLEHGKFPNSPIGNNLTLINSSHSGARSWPSSVTTSSQSTKQSSPRRSMEGNLSREATSEDLKKALEEELSLDGSDLRSCAWYHGTILRQRAEELVTNTGDFVVRDCISQPGDFVITCKWDSIPLHFIIKKIIFQRDTVYEKIQYCFENESFDSIPDFITYYVGSKCPLSSSSGAVISRPINRTMPLTYYASRYGVQCQIHYVAKALENIPSSPQSTKSSPARSPRPMSDDYPKHQSLNLVKFKTGSLDLGNSQSPIQPPVLNQPSQPMVMQRSHLTRVGSDPMLSPNTERRIIATRPNSGCFSSESAMENALQVEGEKPPPKPSRVPSRRCAQKPIVLKRVHRISESDEECDSSSIPIPQSSAAHPVRINRQISETRSSFLDRPGFSDDLAIQQSPDMPFTIPLLSPPSTFDVLSFRTSLLDTENKPLESKVLEKVKVLLMSESAKVIACHLTRIDMEVAKGYQDVDLGLGIINGLELIFLPQGEQLRKDLIERTDCMKLFVAITILSTTQEKDRVKLINKWIEIAIETKTTMGNFYGFTSIMLGLTIPEVSQLDSTWLSLRAAHTESAFAFETKLRPVFKALQETSNLEAPNTCLPYILSLIIILQKHINVTRAMEDPISNQQAVHQNILSFNLPGEQNTSDFGLQLLEDHLEVGRHIMQNFSVFHQNGETSLRNVKYQHMLLDVFCTEFHLKMLWGSRGAGACGTERYQKFQKVLELLYERCK